MTALNKAEIEKLIPHRRTMLLLDGVEEYSKGQTLTAFRQIEAGDVFLDGHFDGNPVFPGVMQLEAMAQAAAVLTSMSTGLNAETAGYLFVGVESLRWKAPVLPGSTLKLHVEQVQEKMGIYKFNGTATVGDVTACTATFIAKLIRK